MIPPSGNSSGAQYPGGSTGGSGKSGITASNQRRQEKTIDYSHLLRQRDDNSNFSTTNGAPTLLTGNMGLLGNSTTYNPTTSMGIMGASMNGMDPSFNQYGMMSQYAAMMNMMTPNNPMNMLANGMSSMSNPYSYGNELSSMDQSQQHTSPLQFQSAAQIQAEQLQRQQQQQQQLAGMQCSDNKLMAELQRAIQLQYMQAATETAIAASTAGSSSGLATGANYWGANMNMLMANNLLAMSLNPYAMAAAYMSPQMQGANMNNPMLWSQYLANQSNMGQSNQTVIDNKHDFPSQWKNSDDYSHHDVMGSTNKSNISGKNTHFHTARNVVSTNISPTVRERIMNHPNQQFATALIRTDSDFKSSKQFQEIIVKQYLSEGISVRRFCKKYGLASTTLCRWKKHYFADCEKNGIPIVYGNPTDIAAGILPASSGSPGGGGDDSSDGEGDGDDQKDSGIDVLDTPQQVRYDQQLRSSSSSTATLPSQQNPSHPTVPIRSTIEQYGGGMRVRPACIDSDAEEFTLKEMEKAAYFFIQQRQAGIDSDKIAFRVHSSRASTSSEPIISRDSAKSMVEVIHQLCLDAITSTVARKAGGIVPKTFQINEIELQQCMQYFIYTLTQRRKLSQGGSGSSISSISSIQSVANSMGKEESMVSNDSFNNQFYVRPQGVNVSSDSTYTSTNYDHDTTSGMSGKKRLRTDNFNDIPD